MEYYMADFETTTSVYSSNESRVWLYYIENIYDMSINDIGVNIDGFFNYLQEIKKPSIIYFHNLNGDGEFLLNYMVEHCNYVAPTPDRKNFGLPNNGFTNSSDGASSHYIIKYKNQLGIQIRFQCSYKMLQASVSALQNVKEKDKIDYDVVDLPSCLEDVTKEQEIYVKKDVKTVIPYMQEIIGEFGKQLGITISSSGTKKLKTMLDEQSDGDVLYSKKISGGRLAPNGTLIRGEGDSLALGYRGGYCYVNSAVQGKLVECDSNNSINVGDYNSLYPYVMAKLRLPYGYALYNCGTQTKCDHDMQLLEIKCSFKIKKNGIPFLPKNDLDSSEDLMGMDYSRRFEHIEYMSEGKNEILRLTNQEWELANKGYDIFEYKILRKICFKSQQSRFSSFFNHYQKMKQESEKGSPKYKLSKVVQNSQYGKQGQNYCRKVMFLRPLDPTKDTRKNIVRYGLVKHWVFDYFGQVSTPLYLPLAIFITAQARCLTLEVANQANQCKHLEPERYSGFCYSDTDSIHFVNCKDCLKRMKSIFSIHPTKLGDLDNEGNYQYGLYFRRKTYIEFNDIDSTKRNVGGGGIDKLDLEQYTNRQIVDRDFKLHKRQKIKVLGGVLLVEKDIEGKEKENQIKEWK